MFPYVHLVLRLNNCYNSHAFLASKYSEKDVGTKIQQNNYA